MILSQSLWTTYKDAPQDAQLPSHILMIRAGLIHKSAMGIYNYLPMGLRAIRKVENIVREEMDKISCEIHASLVTPGELWKESTRWNEMATGPEKTMLAFQDKREQELCIGPTHEEAFVDVFRSCIKSYKQLPLSLYQINTKFRDEIRPRFGLIRAREFIMKDAYTFHLDQKSMDETYEQFFQSYQNIFQKLGLNFIAVQADAGQIGGTNSKNHEFQVLTNNGEDCIAHCQKTGYAANLEKAQTLRPPLSFEQNTTLKEVKTPGKKTIETVCQFLDCPQHHSLKSLVYVVHKDEREEPILIQLLGDDQLNEVKLNNYLGSDALFPATEQQLSQWGFEVGFIGPHQPPQKNLRIILDAQINGNAGYTVGANRTDFHYTGMVPQRDIPTFETTDLRLATEGDLTLDGKGEISIHRGIEVGHIFQLGDKYTRSMNTTVLGKDNRPFHPLMGCYGIGITRIVATAIEQNCDKHGILWPQSIAPFHVSLILLSKSEQLQQTALELYELFWREGIETLLDDRKLGPGFKFKDANLLGLPLQVVVSDRHYTSESMLEVIERKSQKKTMIPQKNIVATIKEKLQCPI